MDPLLLEGVAGLRAVKQHKQRRSSWPVHDIRRGMSSYASRPSPEAAESELDASRPSAHAPAETLPAILLCLLRTVSRVV